MNHIQNAMLIGLYIDGKLSSIFNWLIMIALVVWIIVGIRLLIK